MRALRIPALRIEIDGVAIEPGVANNVERVEVVHELDTLDHFAVTVVNPFPNFPFTHGEQAGLFEPGSAIVILLGYPPPSWQGVPQGLSREGLVPVFDGEITRMNATFPGAESRGGEAPTVRVAGHTRLHRLTRVMRTRTFLDSRDSDIARQLAAEHSLEAQVDDTDIAHPYVLQYNQSDLAFLLARALQNGFTVWGDARSLFFRAPTGGAETTYSLVWGRPSDAARAEIVPLKSFDATLDAAEPVDSVVVRGQDPNTREVIEGRAGVASAAAPGPVGNGGAPAGARALGTSEVVVVDQPVASQAEADQRALAYYNDQAEGLVVANGSTWGEPGLRAGAFVQVTGVGPRFDGSYRVTRSTHRYDRSGYETSFTAARSGSA